MIEEYGDYISVFLLNGYIKNIKGDWSNQYNTYVNRIMVTLDDATEYMVHDSTQHGYNGKLGIADTEISNSQKVIAEFANNEKTSIIMAFQYGGDEGEYANENNDKNPQDYFDWVVIYSLNSNGLNKLIEFECA